MLSAGMCTAKKEKDERNQEHYGYAITRSEKLRLKKRRLKHHECKSTNVGLLLTRAAKVRLRFYTRGRMAMAEAIKENKCIQPFSFNADGNQIDNEFGLERLR